MNIRKYLILPVLLILGHLMSCVPISTTSTTTNPTNSINIIHTPTPSITYNITANPTKTIYITESIQTTTMIPTVAPTITPSPTVFLPTPTIYLPPVTDIDIAYAYTLDGKHYCGVSDERTYNFVYKYGGFHKKDNGLKRIYLTYNLGSEYGLTNELLDLFKEKNVKATFFPSGSYVRNNTPIIKRIVAEGHLLGSHGETHDNHNKWPLERIANDIDNMQKRYKDIFGQDFRIVYYRPPYGYFNEKNLYVVQQKGLINVFWSFSYADWEANKTYGVDNVCNMLMKNLQDGMIFQLHIANRESITSISKFIDLARLQGYEFYRVDE